MGGREPPCSAPLYKRWKGKTMMKYERTEPLPKHEEKFESFYIRYDVEGAETDEPWAIRADVWKVCEWSPEGKPVFFNMGPNAPGMDPAKTEPLFNLLTKFDSCSHLRMGYLHFDGLEELDAFTRVIKYICENICERHNVGD